MEKPANTDEIDLIEVLVKVVLLIKRNLLQIVIFFSVGTGLGYAYASFAPKVYESKMLVSSEILTESYSEKLFENLQKLITEQNYEELSPKINLTETELKSIGKVALESAFKDNPSKEDEKKFFQIIVQLTDRSLLPKLQAGIINYLQQNDFAKIRVEQRKIYFKEMIKKVDEEILSLESFKEKVYKGNFFESTGGRVVFFDPTTVNTKIVDLNQQKLDYQNQLELVSSLQIIEGFTQFDKPIWPKKSVSLAAGATLGLFLVGLLIAFKSIRKLVRFAESHPSRIKPSN